MHVDNNVGYLLHHLAANLDRQSDSILQQQLKIGFSQFKILMALKWRTSVQQKQIAEYLGQTEASISRQIRLLQEQGLIQNTVSPNNRRQHITTLTAKGDRIAGQAMQLLNNYHAPVFAALSEYQQQVLMDLLQRLHEKVCHSGHMPIA